MLRSKKRSRKTPKSKRGTRRFQVGGHTYTRHGKFSISDSEGQPLDF